MRLNGCKGPVYPKIGGKVVLSGKVRYDGVVLSSNEANRLTVANHLWRRYRANPKMRCQYRQRGELKVSGTFFGFFHHEAREETRLKRTMNPDGSGRTE